MAERKAAKKDTQRPAEGTTGKASKGFTDEERAAMKERAHELKAATRRGPRKGKADGESDVLAKIAEMPERIAPWPSGSMPSSQPARRPLAENLVWDACVRQGRQRRLLFQSAQKFKTRYATFGFSDKANLDDGTMWPVSFALKELTAAAEKRIGALVKKAVN